MMTQTAELDDGIRLTKRQAQVLEAVVSQHAETRRAVPLMIVQAYCNARSVVDQDAVLTALAKLRRLDLVRIEGEAILPVTGCMDRLTPGAPADEEPPPTPDVGHIHPEHGVAIAGRHGLSEPLPCPDHDLKTCRHCDVMFRRPDEAPIPDDRCERCHDELEALSPEEASGCKGYDSQPGQHHAPECPAVDAFQAGRIPEPQSIRYGASSGKFVEPGSQFAWVGYDLAPGPGRTVVAVVEAPRGSITISPELLDRCAAMHLTLLEQAREAYAQGDQAAGRELQWLIDTGEQLVAAGGGV